MVPEDLPAITPAYDGLRIHKLSGGMRRILAPEASFKEHQRRILHRLLGRLKAHDAAHGFERGRSIATHARHHVGKALVVRLDLKDFFPSTTEKRVQRYFRLIGWNRKAAALPHALVHVGGRAFPRVRRPARAWPTSSITVSTRASPRTRVDRTASTRATPTT